MRSVLADTGPLYALVDPDDQHHGRSQDELGRITEEGRTILVAFPTVLESYTLVLRRLGFEVAQSWLQELTRGVGLINPSRADYFEAGRWTGRYSDQMITLFDAVVAVASDQLGIPVWTFDRHFDVMRARVWR